MKTLIRATTLKIRYISKNIPKNSALNDDFYILQKELTNINKQCKKNLFIKKYPSKGKMYDKILSLFCDGKIKSENNIIDTLKIENFNFSELMNLRFFIFSAVTDIIFENIGNSTVTLNAISSMRKINDYDFNNILLQSSKTERLLLTDPGNIYPYMSDETKSIYRNAIIKNSADNKINEYDYVKNLINKSNNCPDADKKHIGFYIPELNKDKTKNGYCFILLRIILPIIISLCICILTERFYMFIISVFPFYEICKNIIALLSTETIKDIPLLRMDNNYIKSDKFKTGIVISELLCDKTDFNNIKNKLVILYKTSIENSNYICLCADLKQCETPRSDMDNLIYSQAEKMIDELNKKYNNRFVMIIRNRTFSKTQNIYCGFERKRGAIEYFCGLINNQTNPDGKFFGDFETVKYTKYIAVLDSDTFLPNEQLSELIKTASHPLNRPEISYKKRMTIKGYGIIMPKTETTVKSAHSSYFAHLLAGHGGIDGYNTLTGENYQRILGKTIFMGKGLIDVNCYNKLLTSRFENEKILSHDIAEGIILRTAFAGDITVTDSFPSSPQSYLARQHRWIRGDMQNLLYFIKNKNNFSFSDFFWLSDNILRALTPPVILLSLMLSFFMPDKFQTFSSIILLSGLCFDNILSFITSVIGAGHKFISRLYYSDTIPSAIQNLIRTFIKISMLPAESFTNINAIIKASVRFTITKKNLLEWTTASQSENKGNYLLLLLKTFIYGIIGFFLIAFYSNTAKIFGIFFVLSIPLFLLSDKKIKYEINVTPTKKQIDTIKNYVADMWKYFDKFVTEKNNFLPCDNIQFFPSIKEAQRTSPTNIGLYLVCVLGAKDLDFISTNEMTNKIKNTLNTVEKLSKYKGQLYNWYNTETLDVLYPEYISTVDSGNFIICLVTLKQGLKQYENENKAISEIIEQCENLIKSADFDFLYNKTRNLFRIGYNKSTDKLSDSYYDLLMSESRLTSFYALSNKIVPLKHLQSLSRALVTTSRYTGCASWSGTMFEYFMPTLFLPVYKNTVYDESLKFCLHAQKIFAEKRNIPWGVSESCYFSFDNELNYQYKANSIPTLALCKANKNEAVISPYSSFLTLITDINSSLKNLDRLKKYNMYSSYGFYEAIDFTKERLNIQQYEPIKTIMTHHTGMSFIQCVNVLNNNIMQKRFAKDEYSISTLNLLEEKVPIDSPVYKKDSYFKRTNIHEKFRNNENSVCKPDILSPSCNIYNNGKLTLLYSSNGENNLIYKGLSLLKKTTGDILSPGGIFSAVKIYNKIYPFTFSPFYKNYSTFSTDYNKYAVTANAHFNSIKLYQKYILSENNPSVIIKYMVTTEKATDNISLMIYFEPLILDINNKNSHPAFSKLFITADCKNKDGIIIFTRQSRDNEKVAYIVCGFNEKIDYSLCMSREDALKYPDGYFSMFKLNCNTVSMSADKCCYIVTKPHKVKNNADVAFILSAGDTENEAIDNFNKAKNEVRINKNPTLPFNKNELTGIFCKEIIKNIFFTQYRQKELYNLCRNTELTVSTLWKYGISGDSPIVTVYNSDEIQIIISFIKIHKTLTLSSINTELVFIIKDDNIYFNSKYNIIKDLLNQYGIQNTLNIKNGIFIVNENITDKNDIEFIKSKSVFIYPYTESDIHKCIEINSITQSGSNNKNQSGFTENGYLINESTPLPYSTVLANPSFGTLLSNNSLGFTWAINSALNKITPWSNDTMTDNYGEKLFIEFNGNLIDIIKNSTVFFSKDKVIYSSYFDELSFITTVTVPSTGMKKNIFINVTNNSPNNKEFSILYYCEIINSNSNENIDYIKNEIYKNSILFKNTANNKFSGYSAITTDINNPEYIFGNKNYLIKNSDNKINCCTIKGKIILPGKKSEIYKYVLSYGKTKESAIEISKLNCKLINKNSLTIETSDNNFNIFFNNFLPSQIINSRLYGRTGFYQNSGAYGFRDQLQDVLSLIYTNPELVIKQIYRSASLQFLKGDVFHWYHIYADKTGQTIFGNRTQCSDDFLWLPYAVSEYCQKTGDYSVLSKKIPYLFDKDFCDCFETTYSDKKESLYTHCIRAINHSLHFGSHNLPLIKEGDWNDSFNEIGKQGKGESVWLGMFLKKILDDFLVICRKYNDEKSIIKYEKILSELNTALDNSFDTDRYIRAYFDDGEPMGNKNNEQCEIDLLTQSFSVISNLDNKSNNSTALKTSYNLLVDKKYGIIRLFSPGFEYNGKKAGYVNSYPIGIRENAGQYTHGAVWLCDAFFKSGDYTTGYELLNMLLPYKKNKEIYKTEPFYTVGDVYYTDGMKGRGGWSLYTGSAGWLYKTIYEDIFGLQMNNGKIKLNPCIPENLKKSKIKLNFNGKETEFKIQ